MFGYITPEKPELKIREYEIFKAYYCAICKSIGKRYGQIPRFILSYDTTFLALLLSSLSSLDVKAAWQRCILHPVKKRKVLTVDGEFIDYAADMNVILAYYNLKDDVRDEKSVTGIAGSAILATPAKKIKKLYMKKCLFIEEKLRELEELENNMCNSVDIAAEPFARLIEEIILASEVPYIKNNINILKWTGYNLGKWIYMLDAYDDLEKDIEKNRYNPFVYQYKYGGTGLDEFKRQIKDKVEFNLTYTLNQIAGSIGMLDIKKNKGIIENIIFLGMLRKTEQILKVGRCSKIEKSL